MEPSKGLVWLGIRAQEQSAQINWRTLPNYLTVLLLTPASG